MTTATAIASPAATQPPRAPQMTVDDYLALPEREGIWELVDGVLVKMAEPNHDHQELISVLYWLIRFHLIAAIPRLGIALPGIALALSRSRVAVPDLVYVRAERQHLWQGRIITGAPDLVVEVMSQDRAKDLIRNRQWYAEAGIPEYWIIDPVNDTLTILELSNGQYTERAVLGRNDTLTTPTLPGLTIPLTELFDDPDRVMLRQP